MEVTKFLQIYINNGLGLLELTLGDFVVATTIKAWLLLGIVDEIGSLSWSRIGYFPRRFWKRSGFQLGFFMRRSVTLIETKLLITKEIAIKSNKFVTDSETEKIPTTINGYTSMICAVSYPTVLPVSYHTGLLVSHHTIWFDNIIRP